MMFMSLKINITLLLIVLLGHDVLCSLHEPPSMKDVLIGYHGTNGVKHDETHQFRISTVYDTNVSMKALNERDLAYLKSVVDEALLPFSSLQIKHEPQIFLNYTCTEDRQGGKVYCKGKCDIPKCGSMKVPTEYLGSCVIEGTIKMQEGIGTKAHFLLFVTLGTMVKNCNKKEVYSISAHCQQGYMDRPIAAYIDICKEKVVERKLRSQELTHDILHTLAFSQSLYPFFRDANGIPRTDRNNDTNLPPMNHSSFFVASDSTIRNVSINWLAAYGSIIRNVTIMVTENVVKASRIHFGCSDLEGALLEDGAGMPGFAMSHFEKRVFKNEIMTGTHNDEVFAKTYAEQYVFSNLTLAVLRDSGWYIVDTKSAQHLPYAHRAGCKFVRSSCLEWAQTRCSDCFNPYCNELKDTSTFYRETSRGWNRSCAPSRKGIMDCDMVLYKYVMKPMFRYITTYDYFRNYYRLSIYRGERLGGPDELFDYCPIYNNFNWDERYSEDYYKSKCDNVINNKRKLGDHRYWHEIYGEKSKCFDYGEEPWGIQECGWRKNPLEQLSGACYKYMCHKNMLYIGVKREIFVQYYQCAKKGQVINIYRALPWFGVISGSIVCPDCSEICNDCVSKKFKSLKEFERFQKNIGDDPIDPCSVEHGHPYKYIIRENETTIYSNIKLYCSYSTHLNYFYSLVLTLIIIL